jgi:hypothetical protein
MVSASNVVSTVGEFKKYVESVDKAALLSNEQISGLNQLAICNALISAVLSRSSSFSQDLLSEAMQTMNITSICVLLRSLSHSLFNLVELRHQCCSKSINELDMENTVMFVEALIDAHFLQLSLHAVNDSEIRRTLFKVIKVVKEAERSTIRLEETLGLWTQIERVSSKGGAHIKNNVGTYQIEKLSL